MISSDSDLYISDIRFSAPSIIECAFYFYSMSGASLKWRKSEEKMMYDGWPGRWAMMNEWWSCYEFLVLDNLHNKNFLFLVKVIILQTATLKRQ